MGSFKEFDEMAEKQQKAAEVMRQKAESAVAEKEAIDRLISSVSIDGRVSLPDALDVLSKAAPGQLDGSKASKLRGPIVEAMINSEVLKGAKGNAFISGMPENGHEKSVAAAIAGRFPESRVFSVGELRAFNPYAIKAQTVVVYGFPTNAEGANAAAEIVLAKQTEFNAACQRRQTTGIPSHQFTGRMLVLAGGELDLAGLTRRGELEKNFNLGRLTREGMQRA